MSATAGLDLYTGGLQSAFGAVPPGNTYEPVRADSLSRYAVANARGPRPTVGEAIHILRMRPPSGEPMYEEIAMRQLPFFAVMFVISSTPAAVADQLPGTLNFSNVTASRIHQTVGESSQNEKEVDFGDFDNDGDLDVVVANAYSDFTQRRNKLYRNDAGVFNEVSGNPVIPGFSGTDVSRNAFFRDYDLDGWLDIIIVNDNNTNGDPGRTKIYMNQHPGGEFSHFTEEGLARLGSGTGGAACSAVSIDADMDGDVDLYVGNYPGPSQDTMYFNQDKNPGFFTNMTGSHVPGDNDYTVDVSSADMNGDGTLDLLISNHGSGNKLYYNNKNDAGSGIGDYSYSGSIQALGSPGMNENSMEPGDFDNDGDQDFYWSNKIGAEDRVFQNTGNDANDNAIFVMTVNNLPPAVIGRISRKATLADLNDDGRVDLFVGTGSGANARPSVLRNTSVEGTISFIDWSPAPAFPNGSAHRGWHAAAFDSNGDGDLDIFLGGWSNEHLFENVPANEVDEEDLPEGAILPSVYNQDPVAVLGHAIDAEVDLYLATDIGSGAFISVVLNGPDDYLLEVLNSSGGVVGTSNRGGLGVEEALQVNSLSPGDYTIRATVLEAGPNDSIFDLDKDGSVGISDLLIMIEAWGPNEGHPADFDNDGMVGMSDLLALLAIWGPVSPENDYILEVLSRN